MIVGAFNKTGIRTQLSKNATADLIVLDSPGVFVSAAIIKSGGSNDHCEVRLILDGVIVVAINYAAAKTACFDKPNNSGISLSSDVAKTLTIQFCEPIQYKSSLSVQIFTGSEEGIAQVFARVIVGTTCSYPS